MKGPAGIRSPLRTDPLVVFVDAAPVMMWLSQADGWRTFFNKQWLDFGGRRLADEVGDGWASGVHSDDRPRCLAAYSEAVRTGQACTIEFRLRRSDGVFRRVVDRVAPRLDAGGRVDGFIGCCLDITPRVSALQAVKASEARFRLLAENARDMIFRYRLHPTFGCEYISPAALSITGRTPQEFIDNPELPGVAMHPDDRELARAVRADPARFPDPVVVRWIHRDGRIVHVEHRYTPIYDADGRLVALEGIGRDITAHIATETRLRESENQLRRLAMGLTDARETERRLIARELHDDLGQSLTAIKMQLARTTAALVKRELSPEAIDGLQSMIGGIEVATETVRRLATSLRPPAIDHLGLVAAIELEGMALTRPFGVRFRIRGNKNVAHLDPAHVMPMFRIVQEALTNVMRHAKASAVSVTINGSALGIKVTVHDNGRGVTDVQLSDPTAIGLLGMRERAQLIGATLTLTSRPGDGTTVSLVVPAVAANAHAIGGRP